MLTASPPVSPRVVAEIFMIQKPIVTAGILPGGVFGAGVVHAAVMLAAAEMGQQGAGVLGRGPNGPVVRGSSIRVGPQGRMMRMMTRALLVVCALLPGCGRGTEGIMAPALMDMSHIERPGSPNTALAGPAGFSPAPDIVTPAFDEPAGVLFARVVAVALKQKRTYLLSRYDDALQAHFVARSAVFGFPDMVAVQVLREGEGRSRLVIWSRSVYGRSDFGVNQKRVRAWLDGLERGG